MKIIIILLMVLISIVLSTSVLGTYCYQETANISTACGGLDTGGYSFYGLFNAHWAIGNFNTSAFYDGDWNTYTYAVADDAGLYGGYVSINYTKPSNVLNSSLWLLKYKDISGLQIINFSIPISCFEAYEDKLEFRVESHGDSVSDFVSAWCYNGTDYLSLISSEVGSNYIYEEAMWWNISVIQPTTPTTYRHWLNFNNALTKIRHWLFTDTDNNKVRRWRNR